MWALLTLLLMQFKMSVLNFKMPLKDQIYKTIEPSIGKLQGVLSSNFTMIINEYKCRQLMEYLNAPSFIDF